MKEKLLKFQEKINLAKKEISKNIIGQKELIDSLFLGLFSGGHILLEGVPGLAKTESIKTFSEITGISSGRVTFTPDLLPSDIIGGYILDQKKNEFLIKKGPIFTNLLLGDEINRAPSKVQSALLEAMAEKQITIGEKTFKLEEPFLVMATQNPLEQEGTFPLPEAQIDRFFMKIILTYPSFEEEVQIIKNKNLINKEKIETIFSKKEIIEYQDLIKSIYIDDELIKYIAKIVFKTREFGEVKEEDSKIVEYGCSPRASIALSLAVKVNAAMEGRDFASPDDVKKVAKRILRHRIGLSYRAEADNISSDDIIQGILDSTKLV